MRTDQIITLAGIATCLVILLSIIGYHVWDGKRKEAMYHQCWENIKELEKVKSANNSGVSVVQCSIR